LFFLQFIIDDEIFHEARNVERVPQRAIEYEREKNIFAAPNPTLKTRILAFLIDCLVVAFPDNTFEFTTPKVLLGCKQIRLLALSVLREMKSHLQPVCEDFFASAGNNVALDIPESFKFQNASEPQCRHFAAVLELRIFRTTRIPIHHAKKQWIVRGLLSSISTNTGRGGVDEDEEVNKKKTEQLYMCYYVNTLLIYSAY
jgi:hypothetical protein